MARSCSSGRVEPRPPTALGLDGLGLPSAVCRLPSAVCCLLSAVYCLPSAVCYLDTFSIDTWYTDARRSPCCSCHCTAPFHFHPSSADTRPASPCQPAPCSASASTDGTPSATSHRIASQHCRRCCQGLLNLNLNLNLNLSLNLSLSLDATPTPDAQLHYTYTAHPQSPWASSRSSKPVRCPQRLLLSARSRL